MGKQENLDDFLRKNLENDSIFEYNDADWQKAEKLINNSKSSKLAAFSFKKIIGVFSILLALLVVLFNLNFKKELTTTNTSTSKIDNTTKSDVNTINDQIVNSESVSPNTNTTLVTTNVSNTNSNNQQSIISDNSSNSKQSINTKKSQNRIVNNGTNNTTSQSTNTKSNNTDELIINKDSESDYFKNSTNRNINFNRVITSLFPVGLSSFDQNKSTFKPLDNDSTLYRLYNASNDFAETKVEIKPRTLYSFDIYGGLGLNKQFKGNVKHQNTPSLDPFVGLAIQFYINKKVKLGGNLAYSQRRGINNSYVSFNDVGDSDYVNVNKLYALEIPMYASYLLDKHTTCYGGLGAMFYVSNQSDILKASGATKLDKGLGIITTDAFIFLGYQYKFNNNLNVFLNAQIGLRDVTKNQVFNSTSHDDNVSLRFGIGYSIFDRKY